MVLIAGAVPLCRGIILVSHGTLCQSPDFMPPQFKFDGRYVLLTYAQSGDLDAGLVVEHLSRLHAECIVAREDHVDGGTHLHAFCDFGRRFRSRRTDVFDVGGRHPNISVSYGSPDAGYDYAIKDGDVVGGGLGRPSGVGVYEDESAWAVIHRSPDESSFWESVARLDPKTLCTNYRNLRAYVDWRYNTPVHEEYVHPRGVLFELGMVPDLVGWRENSLGSSRGMHVPLHCVSSRGGNGSGLKPLSPPVVAEGLHVFASVEVLIVYRRITTKRSSFVGSFQNGKDFVGPFTWEACLYHGYG